MKAVNNLYELYRAVEGHEPSSTSALSDVEVERLVDDLMTICNAPGHKLLMRADPDVDWLLDVWPRWDDGSMCKFDDEWVAPRYGDREPRRLRRLCIYSPELLDEWGQGDGRSHGYEWDFMRPSDLGYRPHRVAPDTMEAVSDDVAALEGSLTDGTGLMAAMNDYVTRRGVECPEGDVVVGVIRDILNRCASVLDGSDTHWTEGSYHNDIRQAMARGQGGSRH